MRYTRYATLLALALGTFAGCATVCKIPLVSSIPGVTCPIATPTAAPALPVTAAARARLDAQIGHAHG